MTECRAGPGETAASGGKRRIGIAIAGWVLVLSGLAMIFLPGPGVPLLFAGLALLARERPWARSLLGQLKRRGGRIFRHRQVALPEPAPKVDALGARPDASPGR